MQRAISIRRLLRQSATDPYPTGRDKATTVLFYKKCDETVQEVMHFRESRCSKFVYCPETNKLVCK